MKRCSLLSTIALTIALSIPAWGQVTNENLKLLPKDGAPNEEFGWSIDIDNGIIAVGAHQDSAPFTNSGAAYLFDASTGFQLFKLLPNDGSGGDLFGESIGIGGGIVAVGALEDDPNGFQSGSAYIFDAFTGMQIAKLVPSDGGPQDDFGFSIAVDNGIVVVGAPATDDNGSASGSVYLFDAFDGSQIREIYANDAASGDRFGFSVAISKGIIAVGAIRNDDQGSNSGSAYIFNASTGAQIAKLLPSDGASSDFFGWTIAIDSTTVVVGVPQEDNENGSTAGSAYLFDIANGFQTAKLLASDGTGGDNFGNSVAIDNGVVVIGALKEDEGASNGGAVYLFDSKTGAQIEKLLASDSASSDSFGQAVAINNGVIAVGSFLDDDNGPGSGSAYLFNIDIDTDEDGLLDDWEINGVPYINGAGLDVFYVLPGADPMHKDLYVEVDAMAGMGLSDASKLLLEEAFDNAPHTNPDGIDGITLHIIRDESNLPLVSVWQTDGCWPLDFDAVRSSWYGTPAERAVSDPVALLAAKAMAYRYCIVADRSGPEAIGGCGLTPGDSFVIYTGTRYSVEQQAAVFMHELGHNLSLRHGGADNINGKPNYPSIMNYVMSYRSRWNRSFWRLDYLRQDAGEFVNLNELSLDETAGIGTPGGFYSNVWMPFGVDIFDGGGKQVRRVRYVNLGGQPVDFGSLDSTGFQDGFHDVNAQQDLNHMTTSAPDVPQGIPTTPSFGETLNSYNDWANVGLKLAAAIGDGAPAPEFPTDELTTDGRDWIDDNFELPPEVCQADFTGDGSLNFFDISAFLDAFALNDPIADFTGDDRWNFFDISEFLTLFAQGCP